MRIFRNLVILAIGFATLSTQQATAAAPLQTLALHVNNLRPGYTVITSAYRTQAFMAEQFHVPAWQMVYYGWATSYEALYARKDSTGIAEVGNKVDHYTSQVGAHWGYRMAVRNAVCCGKYKVIPMQRVGMESTGFLATSGRRGFIGIKFREGTYVVGVAILPGTKQASLLLLARLVDQRIRLYG